VVRQGSIGGGRGAMSERDRVWLLISWRDNVRVESAWFCAQRRNENHDDDPPDGRQASQPETVLRDLRMCSIHPLDRFPPVQRP
jgi:hypothetical protein